MNRIVLALYLAAIGAPALADIVVPTRTIRANTILIADDFSLQEGKISGAVEDLAQVVGKQTRVALYAGRPVFQNDLGPPTLIERNANVRIIYASGGLRIVAAGRALGRGAHGDVIRVMNMNSRATVFGEVQIDGTVLVGGGL